MENDGSCLEKAIVLENVGSAAAGSHQIYKTIDRMFGGNDEDFFIHTEQTLENKQLGKKYRILYIEDKNGTKRQVWFDITNWS